MPCEAVITVAFLMTKSAGTSGVLVCAGSPRTPRRSEIETIPCRYLDPTFAIDNKAVTSRNENQTSFGPPQDRPTHYHMVKDGLRQCIAAPHLDPTRVRNMALLAIHPGEHLQQEHCRHCDSARALLWHIGAVLNEPANDLRFATGAGSQWPRRKSAAKRKQKQKSACTLLHLKV